MSEIAKLNGYDIKDRTSRERLEERIKFYDSVTDMTSDESLQDGNTCKTLGFYNANDNGGALYKIREKTVSDVIDEMTLLSLYDNTLLAELIIEGTEINILKCGAKNDGTTDVSTIINSLITNFNQYTIYIPNGDYLVHNTILIDTATKIRGENQFKTRLFTDSAIPIMENKNDDIATCYVSDLYLDGNNIGTKGLYLYRDRPNLVYNDSRSYINNLLIKKCTDWCLQIGDPDTQSNVIEIVVDNIYVHEYTGGGIYISRCSDSHFSNLRSGSGLHSTKPAILVEGYNLQIINSKAFLSGTEQTPLSGWVFNGGANIIADIECQANSKHGVEINNTKDSVFKIIADKNSLVNNDYAGILINNIQNCKIDAIISNNVATNQFETLTGCKIIEPKKLILNIDSNNDVSKILDLSEYNTNQVLTVNSTIKVNGYTVQDITPVLNDPITVPSGITLTKINDESYLLSGSVASDSNIWIAGSYGSHTALTYIDDDHHYDLSTGNLKVGMVLYNYVTNLGGGYNRKIVGTDNEVTGIMIQIKANTTYNDIITPKIFSVLNK